MTGPACALERLRIFGEGVEGVGVDDQRFRTARDKLGHEARQLCAATQPRTEGDDIAGLGELERVGKRAVRQTARVVLCQARAHDTRVGGGDDRHDLRGHGDAHQPRAAPQRRTAAQHRRPRHAAAARDHQHPAVGALVALRTPRRQPRQRTYDFDRLCHGSASYKSTSSSDNTVPLPGGR